MSHKLRANRVALRSKDIICEMRVQWGLECLYGKAWQAKEYAERLVFGPSDESFQLLPSYFYMLEQENPSTMTTVATNEKKRFKYYLWSYGACIWGFRDIMRPTIVIDATHLKGRFKGALFVVVCKDTNEYVYLVALSIGHVEDEDSWTWFLSKLRDAVGCLENTMFISDQHLDIKKAIQNAYPEAHHGLCGYHLKKNFKNKFKRDDLSMLFTLLEIAISKCKREAIEFYVDYYKTIILVEGYSGSIHPIGHPKNDGTSRTTKGQMPLSPRGGIVLHDELGGLKDVSSKEGHIKRRASVAAFGIF
ncbi:MULE transposase domain - like 3 [Theobroma cacao]|nr:MULE transposase domain - like 3 [Theobroma cacao]